MFFFFYSFVILFYSYQIIGQTVTLPT